MTTDQTDKALLHAERQEWKMEKENKKPRGFYVEKGSFFVHAAIVILAVSMAIRLLGSIALFNDGFALATQVLLPLICAVLFIAFILIFGRIAVWSTILPVLGGAAFFILSSTNGDDRLGMVVCIILAFVAAFVYTATLSGMIRTKWLLAAVFAGILAYQIVLKAIPAFADAENPVSFAQGMDILSSIGMILAMLCVSLAIKRAKPVKQEAELPKIKDPKPVLPKGDEPAAEPASDTEELAGESQPAAEEKADENTEEPAAEPAQEPAQEEESKTEL